MVTCEPTPPTHILIIDPGKFVVAKYEFTSPWIGHDEEPPPVVLLSRDPETLLYRYHRD